jgi:hypothetical protein
MGLDQHDCYHVSIPGSILSLCVFSDMDGVDKSLVESSGFIFSVFLNFTN